MVGVPAIFRPTKLNARGLTFFRSGRLKLLFPVSRRRRTLPATHTRVLFMGTQTSRSASLVKGRDPHAVLIEAIREGDVSRVEQLMGMKRNKIRGENAAARDRRLVKAWERNHLAVVEAARENQPEILKLLLASRTKGAAHTSCGVRSGAAVTAACERGHLRVLQILLKDERVVPDVAHLEVAARGGEGGLPIVVHLMTLRRGGAWVYNTDAGASVVGAARQTRNEALRTLMLSLKDGKDWVIPDDALRRQDRALRRGLKAIQRSHLQQKHIR